MMIIGLGFLESLILNGYVWYSYLLVGLLVSFNWEESVWLCNLLYYEWCHQEEYDTHDPKGHCSMVLPFLKKRSKIVEIVAARDIVFALAQSGICAAFSRGITRKKK